MSGEVPHLTTRSEVTKIPTKLLSEHPPWVTNFQLHNNSVFLEDFSSRPRRGYAFLITLYLHHLVIYLNDILNDLLIIMVYSKEELLLKTRATTLYMQHPHMKISQESKFSLNFLG